MSTFLASNNLLDATISALDGPSGYAKEIIRDLSLVPSKLNISSFVPLYDDPKELVLEAKIDNICRLCGQYHEIDVAIGKRDGELWSAFINENEIGGRGTRQYMSAISAYLAIIEELQYFDIHECGQD